MLEVRTFLGLPFKQSTEKDIKMIILTLNEKFKKVGNLSKVQHIERKTQKWQSEIHTK